ncbi:glycosyltransferase family 4 protein [Crateriforma conspicua]|uniref:Alpha-D-kanosaminyltransferase n=1 Tax=Crateriforma conspicua TaxID=2527996 RepID=A0A5C5Y5S9_9PLAN|nr:glycosyltransferase family 4 protein [Crateriforma conspicua]TWT71096.1 Alpha-D-kanosaminyltransferase [Crateriforma conspicua]
MRLAEQNVVFLVNFVAPNHLAVLRELASRVRRLTVLSSVAMEANRQWDSQWDDLNVIVQRTRTVTRTAKHPGGYQEPNYIHIPLDTASQLKQLSPDAVVSLEMGARSWLAQRYCRRQPECVHVLSVYASQRSEAGRGWLRQRVRRHLLRRADWVTFNGPSCRRLLLSLGADAKRMSPWDYAADPRKAYRGAIESDVGRTGDASLQVLTVGQLSERKGVDVALRQLIQCCRQSGGRSVCWNLVGDGPLREQIAGAELPGNLQIRLHGHCEPDRLSKHYAANDLLLFPTLGDEWGLVVDEALASALPVVGSRHSQAVETLIENGENGWIYDPDEEHALAAVFKQVEQVDESKWKQLQSSARQSVAHRTPEASACQLGEAIQNARRDVGLNNSIGSDGHQADERFGPVSSEC